LHKASRSLPRIPSSGQRFVPGQQQERNSSGEEQKGFEQQAYKAHQYSVFLYDQLHQQGHCIVGLVSDQRHDWRLHDQTPTICFGSSETKSWEWFLHRIQDQEKPK
jgi:hypothetical protein